MTACRLRSLAVSYALFVARMAHCYVGIIAAEHYLATLGDDIAAFVDTCVYGCLSAAGADGLDLRDGVGYLKQTHRAGEELGEKVCSQTEAEYGHIQLVDNAAELIDIIGGEELALISDDNVCVVLIERKKLKNVVLGLDGCAFCAESDA